LMMKAAAQMLMQMNLCKIQLLYFINR